MIFNPSTTFCTAAQMAVGCLVDGPDYSNILVSKLLPSNESVGHFWKEVIGTAFSITGLPQYYMRCHLQIFQEDRINPLVILLLSTEWNPLPTQCGWGWKRREINTVSVVCDWSSSYGKSVDSSQNNGKENHMPIYLNPNWKSYYVPLHLHSEKCYLDKRR